MKKALILIPLFWGICFLPFYKGEAADTKDHLSLSLTKTIHVKKYKNIKVYYESYTVKEGEWLWKILKDNYSISPEQREKFLHILKRINPTILDASIIQPGQNIFVPVKLDIDTDQSTAPLSAKEMEPSPLQPSSFYTEEHTVQTGECVSNILSQICKVPRHLIFSEYMDHFRKLNPSIEDPDLIKVDQKIILPVFKPSPEKESESAERSSAKPLLTRKVDIQQDIPSTKETIPIDNEQAPKDIIKHPTEGITKPDIKSISKPTAAKGITATKPATKNIVKPAAKAISEPAQKAAARVDAKSIKDSIGTLFADIGDRYNNKGNYHIPIPGGGELTLDTASFPILELENGRKVIIDLGDELPARIEQLIESNWKNYKFVNVRKDDSIKTILNKLFSQSGYESMSKGDKPLALKGEIAIKIWADWTITKERDSAKKASIYAVNIIEERDNIVPSTIKEYLEKHGVRVIDFSVAGGEGHEKDKEIGHDRAEKVLTLNSSNNKDFIYALLSLIDQPYTTNEKLSLLKTSSTGFKMGITADISLKRKGSNLIINLKDLPDEMVTMLNENGFTVLEVKEGESLESIILKLLNSLDIRFSSSTFEFQTARKGNPHNISIAIPGFLINKNNLSKILLTKASLDNNLNLFLIEKGIKVARY